MSNRNLTKLKLLILTVSCLVLTQLVSVAQGGQVTGRTSVDFDTLSKVIMTMAVLVGAFAGFISLKNTNSINVVKADLQQAISNVKIDFEKTLHSENEKLEGKLLLRLKEVESRMATSHDINNLRQFMVLQNENTTNQMKGLEKQIEMAAKIQDERNKKD